PVHQYLSFLSWSCPLRSLRSFPTRRSSDLTVRRLHGAGAKVVVADLADDKGKALEQELGVRYVPTDATSEESVNAAIAEAASLADRKSTRLNSSHGSISYAVFCLKKKKDKY